MPLQGSFTAFKSI